MDYGVVTSLIGIVEQLCLINLLPHNHTQIVQSISEKLRFLQAYLQKSEHPNWVEEGLHNKIRYVAVKAEESIESKLGEVYLVANKGDKEAACEDLHHTLQQALKDIESVEVHIRCLLKRRTDSSLDDGSSTPSVKIQNITNGGSSNYDFELENMMIGLVDGFEKTRDMLFNQPFRKSLQVISIVGMGGSGKTTLAKRVYTDPLILSHFDIRVWTVVSQQYNLRKLLIGILGSIVSLSSSGEISEKDDEQLAEQLRKSLMGRRYLIVMDDVWTTEVWDAIQGIIPDNSNGSRVLITSRYVAPGEYIYRPRDLNFDEKWNLFTKIIASNGNGKCFLSPEFELIGRRIVQRFTGLPILIVLIGGLLATLNNSPKQWEDVESEWNKSIFYIEFLPEFHYIIQVCYNYLPSHLKPCFLYFGVFSQHNDIQVNKLIKLWVAEGFVNLEMNKSLEEVAEDYLCDLINRRLVQVNKRSFDGKIKSCMLHDLVHEFCLNRARRENIMMVSSEYHDFLVARRWINCQSTGWPITTSSSLLNNSSLKTRTILYFGENIYFATCRLIFPSFKLLRVLDLSLIKYWHGIPSEIVDLVHLRYLALTTVGSLYNLQLFKLQNLQTLILFSWTIECQLQLPQDILYLPWLRHVHIDKGSSLYLPSVVQAYIQTLLWLKVISWDSRTTDFTRIPNVKELGIYIEGEVSANTLGSLVQLHQLEKLKFEMGNVECFTLPTSFPLNLKQLTLRNTYLSWEDMGIIAKLPNLELLKLKDFAFCGPEWKPLDGGFQQLKFLLIERSDLEHWNANAHHFPVLERLLLRYCLDLEKLPNDFLGVYTLRLIELDNCSSSLVTSAKEIQQGQRDLGYEALVVRDVTKVELPTNENSEKEESAM